MLFLIKFQADGCLQSAVFLFILFLSFILFIISLMLTITEQILFTIKNSNKMLIDSNTLVKKPNKHETFYQKRNKIK